MHFNITLNYDLQENFVLPSSRHADIIVPGAANSVAVDLIVTHLKQQLTQRSRFLRKALSTASPSCSDLPPNVKIIEQTATRNVRITALGYSQLTKDRHYLPYYAIWALHERGSSRPLTGLPHISPKKSLPSFLIDHALLQLQCPQNMKAKSLTQM